MKKLYKLLIPLLFIIFFSCYDNPVDNIIGNEPPDTFLSLFPDSTIANQQSKLKVHWWGDDKDGIIAGYYFTYNDVDWYFTTKNDSTIAFIIKGRDTVYNFKVAAVDDMGNGLYDFTVNYKGKNLGGEPFTDQNGNGKYDAGEPYIDLGLIDQTPADVNLPLRNTAPEISFLKDKSGTVIAIPETTFTVASFGWNASDLDGDETITKIYIALNDTANKIQLPGNVTFVTLKAKPPFSGNTVDCQVYLGTTINQPYSVTLPNLKLDNTNVLYVMAEDIAGARSKFIRMPDTSAVKNWYVKKPKGEVLIIDDYSINDNAAAFYRAEFDSIGLGNKYDVLDIGFGKTSSASGSLLPKYINPMFTETMKLFKYVLWYTDNNPSLEAAQSSVRYYLDGGGKIMMSMLFPQFFDTRGLSDFLPIDSLNNTPINIIPQNTSVNATLEAGNNNYPNLQVDNSSVPVARVRTFYPSPTVFNLYKLGLNDNPIIGFKSSDNHLVFLGLPLHRLNGGQGNIKKFLNKVFREEFGASK